MLILLPPSEGKTSPGSGAPLDLDSLLFPTLAGERRTVLGTLTTASALPDALSVLGVGASLEDEVRANVDVLEAYAAPGHQVYSGVLFEALDYATLSDGARTRARKDALVFSGLFGATALGDRIPAYRLPITAKLPGLGGLAAWWKPRIGPELDELAEHTGVVVDCRSGGYAALWRAPAQTAVTVDVFQLRDGKRTVVSHFAKHTRGLVARILLEAGGRTVRSPQSAAEAVAQAGDGSHADGHQWEVDLMAAHGKTPAKLEVTLPEG